MNCILFLARLECKSMDHIHQQTFIVHHSINSLHSEVTNIKQQTKS